MNLDNLAILNDIEDRPVALTSNDDVTTLPAWLLGDLPDENGKTVNATACVVILVKKSHEELDAFYFYFYSYDRGANLTQVMEPLNRLIKDANGGMSFGDHIGDWEHNMVRFQAGKPTGIYYSQHAGGAAYNWNDDHITLKNDRPLVFSAYGSHANYPSAGNHVHDEVLIDYCDAGKLWDPVASAYFYQFNPANSTLTRMFVSGSTASRESNLTSYLYYKGLWGDAQYPDSHPLQKTIPHFGLKRFVSGPQGPIVKQLVRKGLFPNKRARKSWMQWAVGVFMSWYPCCIRGWRKWVFGVVWVLFIIVAVLAARHAVKTYKRKKGYRKIEPDIPLSDLDLPRDYYA